MVTCNGYRNLALLAKIASTTDVMSHGRLICGLGAGWYEHEWRAYGYGFPDVPERMGAFREACEIIYKIQYPFLAASVHNKAPLFILLPLVLRRQVASVLAT
jgi:alkanesulfonate monooxygenase SsuD/methylene tetrahydromethanopterin reductase-like flavin-dependent oxidoreductase (luciferase family)